MSPCELDKPQLNGVEDHVVEGGEREVSDGRDCDDTEGEGTKDGSSGDHREEQKTEGALNLETLEEEEQTSECGPAEPADGADVTEEGQEKAGEEEN